jgi:tripartite-type tricarboxylate transporter receptor subunit TctC
VQSPEVRERMQGLGFEATGNNAQAFAAFIASESAKNEKVIRDAGIKPE